MRLAFYVLVTSCCFSLLSCGNKQSSLTDREMAREISPGLKEEKYKGAIPFAASTQKAVRTYRFTYVPNGNGTLHIVLDGEDTVRKFYPLSATVITALTQVLSAKNPAYDITQGEFSCTDTVRKVTTDVPIAKAK